MRQQREFCERCLGSLTETDWECGECTQCGYPLPEQSESLSQSLLRSVLQLRIPQVVESARRAAKTREFDVDEVMERHARLIELAARRGYSVKALIGLVRAAEDAWQMNHA